MGSQNQMPITVITTAPEMPVQKKLVSELSVRVAILVKSP